MKLLVALLLLIPAFAYADDLQVSVGSEVVHTYEKVIDATLQQPVNFLHGTIVEESATYVGSSIFKGYQSSKLEVSARLLKPYRRVFIGLGLAYGKADTYDGSPINFSEVFGVRLTDHVSIRYSHISDAGWFKGTNVGRNFALVSYNF